MDDVKNQLFNLQYTIKNINLLRFLFFLSLGLVVGSRNFMLYHIILELSIIIISFIMFLLALHTYYSNKDNRIILLGMSYGFIACLDLLHILTYSGRGEFIYDATNISIQLWIAARLLESLSIIISFALYNKKIGLKKVVFTYLTVTGLLVVSIFYLNIFPVFYMEGYGPTFFQTISQYIICTILFIGIIYFLIQNYREHKKANIYVVYFLVATTISEIFLIKNDHVFSLSALLGHTFRFIFYHLIYMALVQSSSREALSIISEINKALMNGNKSWGIIINKYKPECREGRRLDLKTSSIGTISHEIRTPLNIILGVTQLLPSINKGNGDKVYVLTEKQLNIIKKNCYRLIKLSDDIIDMVKIDIGHMQLKLGNHNIISIVEDITLAVAEYIKGRNITLVFDTDMEERIVACDRYEIERVMLNLLSNAVKFTGPGGHIKVNINNKEDRVIIWVEDNGIGIPEDMVDEIFDRFKQVDTTLRRKHEGSGIGLSIVKSIVELHGGKVLLESEVGKGSRFIIELPVSLVDYGEENKIYINRNEQIDRVKIEFSDIYELNY
ncbi:MAG: hypothetical protein GXY88_10260 [Tissierellia bacterium]|nr:hypothetical protein [Tissierellia bacterium]